MRRISPTLKVGPINPLNQASRLANVETLELRLCLSVAGTHAAHLANELDTAAALVEPPLGTGNTSSLTAPSGLSASASGTSSVGLSWTNNDLAAASYTLLRSVNGGSFATLATLDASNSNTICTMNVTDAVGDSGTISLNCEPSGLGDGSLWPTSGSLTISSSSDVTNMPLGSYPLIANSAPSNTPSTSANGGFIFDNLLYPANSAMGGNSFLTNNGLLFGNANAGIEINIWGNGGGDYAFWEAVASSYPIQQNSGASVSTLSVFCTATAFTDSTVSIGNTYVYKIVAFNSTATSGSSNLATVTLLGPPAKLVYQQQPGNVTAGAVESPSIVVDVEDQYGNIVTTDSSNVTLSVATGPGSALGTLAIQAVNGVATFSNVAFNTSGTYSLIAEDAGLSSSVSTGFMVNPAAATQLVYAQQPGNIIAGNAESPPIAVSAEDQFGNIVTTDNSTVMLTAAGGPGSVLGTVAVSLTGGVGTFSDVSINLAGNYTLIATDGNLTPSSSDTFTVSPAAAVQLVYAQQPGNVTAGAVQRPPILLHVEDQYGNIITTDGSTIALAVNTGSGQLTGTTATAAVDGIATFGDVTIIRAGNYTLTATDGNLTPAISTAFNVVPAAAASLVYTVQPGDAVVGAAENPQIALEVEDRFGNLVNNDNSTVTLAVSIGPASMSGTLTTSATGGIAVFGDVKFDAAGMYALSASDGALPPAISNSFSVVRDGTSTAVTSSVNSSAFAQAVTFTVHVKANLPSSGVPKGIVTFLDGLMFLGTAALDAQGVAVFTTTALSSGSHPITAVYDGDSQLFPSDSTPLDQTVNQAPLQQNVYQLYNRRSHDHILTASLSEYQTLLQHKWTQQGITFQAYSTAVTLEGVTAVPLYRLVSKNASRHTWTTSASELAAMIKSKAWKVNGTDGYVLPTQVSGSMPIYRLFTRAGNQHLVTNDLNLYIVPRNKNRWISQGIVGYITATEN